MENFNIKLVNDHLWDKVDMLCEDHNDPTAAYNCFIDIYLLAFNKHFPEKLVKQNRMTTPINEWMTKGLLRSCNKRSKLYKNIKNLDLF